MQPNQGGYPPQGYGPPAQYVPQGAPQGYGQPAPQGYAPQAQYAPQGAPQGYAPPAQHAAPASTGDEFGNPDAVGGPRVKFADAGPGRLVLITPTRIERGVVNRLAQPDASGQLPTQDRMTAHVVFLDGPPFMYGGDPQGENGPPKPHTNQAVIPHEARNMFISNVLIVQQCEGSIPGAPGNPTGGKVLGRLVKGQPSKPGLRPPWKLDDPTEQDRQMARDYLRMLQERAITAPAPAGQPYPQNAASAANAPTGYPQGAPGPQGSYAAPGGVTYAGGGGGGYPPQSTYATGSNGQPAAAAYLGDPAAAAQYAPQGQQPPAPPAYGGIGGGQMPDPSTTPPPGWSPEVWATVPDDQRSMIWAAQNAQRPGI